MTKGLNQAVADDKNDEKQSARQGYHRRNSDPETARPKPSCAHQSGDEENHQRNDDPGDKAPLQRKPRTKDVGIGRQRIHDGQIQQDRYGDGEEAYHPHRKGRAKQSFPRFLPDPSDQVAERKIKQAEQAEQHGHSREDEALVHPGTEKRESLGDPPVQRNGRYKLERLDFHMGMDVEAGIRIIKKG